MCPSVIPNTSITITGKCLSEKERNVHVCECFLCLVVIGRRNFKRKRKLLVDDVKELSSSTIYKQLSNCMDTLTVLDLAPPTRKLMLWKTSGGVDKLLSHTTQPLINAELQMVKVYILYAVPILPYKWLDCYIFRTWLLEMVSNFASLIVCAQVTVCPINCRCKY